MKISYILTVIVLVLATICDPTKAAPQGWVWENEATPSTAPTSTQRPTSGPIPDPTAFRTCMKACPVTSQFNPICGSNGVTYENEGKLKCARRCGAGDVEILFNGSCDIN